MREGRSLIARPQAGKLARAGVCVALGCMLAGVGMNAAMHTAASPNRGDVQSAYNRCANRDILLIPAGTGTGWSSPLQVEKNITIKGAGRDSTFLVNSASGTATPIFQVSAPGVWRITGITFQETWSEGGGIGIMVQGSFGRINHCRFQQFDNRGIWNYGILTLIDHNIFIDCWSDVGTYADQWNAWKRPLGIGTTNAVFGEDNYFHKSGAFFTPVGIDHGQGARAVWRFNVLSNVGLDKFDYWLDAHGNQGSPGYSRTANASTVFTESYSNFISVSRGMRGTYLRGGTHIHYNNTYKANSGNWVSYNNTIMCTEEDGYRCGNPLAFKYPALMQISNSFFFAQTLNGKLVDNVNMSCPGSTPISDPSQCSPCGQSDNYFIQQNRDFRLNEKPATSFYKPIVYPHPRIVRDNDPPVAGAFTLTGPANNATGVAVQPTLTWSHSSGATGYRVQLSSDVFFSENLVDATLAAGTTNYTVPAGWLNSATPYYWRVLALNANGVRAGSDVQSFTFVTTPRPLGAD